MPTSAAYPSLVQSALKKRGAPGYAAAAQRYGRYASSPGVQSRLSALGPTGAPPSVQAAAPAPSPPAAPPAPAVSSSGERLWSALNSVDAPGVSNWVDENKDAIVNRMVPAVHSAFPRISDDQILRALEGSDWRRNYFYNIAHEGFGGAPVYNRGGEGASAGLVFIPGFRPQGVAGALSGTNAGDYGRYDDAGRYLGFRSGLINVSWVY